ncbi:MAG: molybdate ABC transporter substrate-binding protein [Candidatus Omnitrophota bacterium]|nr:molybdate ABC transporter substrate-binding protein [Candidatus Omnitrophota bacterium]MBU2528895.1 molybdate ABC transporter substrate-binding protein [bacterium]MBU3929994.1 molybdate ABC transporter substrate-binding protein [bacterium]MBU4122948.1 molybdate ABC transporter substrate-binding protein [bacterium]
MKKFRILGLVLVVGLGFSACGKKELPELDFFCGAAVKVPMDEIVANFEKETGVEVNVIYSGSGNLLSQMEITKRGDVYLCGSPDYVIIGEEKGLLVKGTSRRGTYLVPAIITPKGNPKNITCLEDLAKKGVRFGIGNPETVCLGLYCVELLDYNNLLEKVMPNTVVFAKGCASTANLAVLGKVDAILGWRVFKAWNPEEVELIEIPGERIPRLSYNAIAVGSFVKNRRLADKFINYVLSAEGKKIFKKWGYISDEGEAMKFAAEAKIGGCYKLPDKYFRIIGK